MEILTIALAMTTFLFAVLYLREKTLNRALVDRLLKVIEVVSQVQMMLNQQHETPTILQSIKDKLDYVISSVGSVQQMFINQHK